MDGFILPLFKILGPLGPFLLEDIESCLIPEVDLKPGGAFVLDAIRQYKKMLCIDEDRSSLKVIREILNNTFGKEVVEVIEETTSEEGMERFNKLQPEIVLCELNMPDMNGLEVCRKIKKINPGSSVILMFRKEDDEDPALKAWEAEADGFLSKPIQKGELLFLVNYFLRLYNLQKTIKDKSTQLKKAFEQEDGYKKNLVELNAELKDDKRRVQDNLKEMVSMNSLLEGKNNQIQGMNEELSSRFDSTVELLTNIIEMKQSDHRGHSERVAESALFIAEKMHLPAYLAQNIKIAAQLHELGIVSLPADEIRKDAMDKGEGRERSRHPLVGEMLLKKFPGFEVIAEIIRHLHENVDGSGVPDGLNGERIPVGSRIISASSFYDHSRLTDPNLSPGEALEQLEKQAGVLFDENVVSLLGEYVDSQDTSPESVKTTQYSVFALKEGMELAADIYSESGINLLRKGTVLDKKILEKVLKFHNVDPVIGDIKIKQK